MSKKKRKQAKQAAENFQLAMTQAGFTGRGAGLSGLLPKGRTQQFLLGALVGAAAAYVLSDEQLRGKLMKSGLNLYTSLMSGYAEMKEQLGDLQAEAESEQQGGA